MKNKGQPLAFTWSKTLQELTWQLSQKEKQVKVKIRKKKKWRDTKRDKKLKGTQDMKNTCYCNFPTEGKSPKEHFIPSPPRRQQSQPRIQQERAHPSSSTMLSSRHQAMPETPLTRVTILSCTWFSSINFLQRLQTVFKCRPLSEHQQQQFCTDPDYEP